MSRGILHIARTHRVVPLWRPSFRRGQNHSETGRCWSHRAAQRELNNEEIFNCQQHGEEGDPIVDRNNLPKNQVDRSDIFTLRACLHRKFKKVPEVVKPPGVDFRQRLCSISCFFEALLYVLRDVFGLPSWVPEDPRGLREFSRTHPSVDRDRGDGEGRRHLLLRE